MKLLFLVILLVVEQPLLAAFPETCIPPAEVTGEDEELGKRFVDNIIHINLKFGSNNYVLSRKGEFGKAGSVTNLSSTLIEASRRHQVYSSYEYEGLGLLDAGSSTLEGYMSKIYVIDLTKGEVLSTLDKCANHSDGYYQNKGSLYYYCEWNCENDKIHKFDLGKKMFVEISGSDACENAKNFKKVTFESASYKRKKDPSGTEYNTSFFPIKVCD